MSFPRYPEYKPSGVEWLGEVPAHWRPSRVKRVLRRLGAGGTPDTAKHEYWVEDASIAWVSIGDMSERDTVQSTVKSISESGRLSKGLEIWPAGTLLFSMYASLGHVAELGLPACTNQAILALLPNETSDVRYLKRWFEHLRPTLRAEASSNTQDNLNAEKVANLPALCPPLEEQAAIAAFLDRETGKIDALVAEQEKLIALLREKRQAVISHAVTKGLNPDAPMKPSGIEWLGDVPAHWEVGPLKRFWSVTDCKHVTAEFVEEGIPLASIREVQSQYVTLDGAKRTTEEFYEQLIDGQREPQAGDLIFSRNATVGEIAQVPAGHERFAMGQDVCLLRRLEQSLSPDYMQHVIRSPVVVEQLNTFMIGSTFKRVNVEQIRALFVPCPPVTEQAEISAYLSARTAALDELTTDAERAIALLKERRSALISAAVTGQIDVRDFAARLTAADDEETPFNPPRLRDGWVRETAV